MSFCAGKPRLVKIPELHLCLREALLSRGGVARRFISMRRARDAEKGNFVR